jgi:hypothetical protein
MDSSACCRSVNWRENFESVFRFGQKTNSVTVGATSTLSAFCLRCVFAPMTLRCAVHLKSLTLHYFCTFSRHLIAFFQRGAIVDALDKHSATPLHKCCEHAHASIVSLLIAASANLNSREKVYGRLPLHSAVRSGCLDAVVQLAQSRADINATDAFSRTALHESCWNASAAHHNVTIFILILCFGSY